MKKKILMISTGGTIASVKTENGLTPALKPQEILSFVPKIEEICEISYISLMNIDSTNITPSKWIDLAKCIKENYALFDGFVILHGTDTMAYSASMLSYLCQNSEKPIVLTGSQKPIDSDITDAKHNLTDSFTYCVSDNACGVSIVFDGKVIVGTRAKKTRSKSYKAFSSINYPYRANIQDGRIMQYLDKKKSKVKFYTKLNGKVGLIKLIPGTTAKTLDFYFRHYDAVVIESFGTGGIPDSEEFSFHEVLQKWQEKNKVVVMCTQVVNEGSDMTVYKVGKNLKEKYGLLESYDMTLESVVCKLMWILGITKDKQKIKELFYTTISGDILYTENL